MLFYSQLFSIEFYSILFIPLTIRIVLIIIINLSYDVWSILLGKTYITTAWYHAGISWLAKPYLLPKKYIIILFQSITQTIIYILCGDLCRIYVFVGKGLVSCIKLHAITHISLFEINRYQKVAKKSLFSRKFYGNNKQNWQTKNKMFAFKWYTQYIFMRMNSQFPVSWMYVDISRILKGSWWLFSIYLHLLVV